MCVWEDVSGRLHVSTLFDKIGKKTGNIVSRVNLSFLTDELQLSVATKTCQHCHMLGKLLTLDQEMSWCDVSLLATHPDYVDLVAEC